MERYKHDPAHTGRARGDDGDFTHAVFEVELVGHVWCGCTTVMPTTAPRPKHKHTLGGYIRVDHGSYGNKLSIKSQLIQPTGF